MESEIAYLTAEREQLEMMLDAHVCTMDKAAGRGPAWTWQQARSANITLQKMTYTVQVALFDKSKGHPFHWETDMTAYQDFQVPLQMKKFLSILCFCIEIHRKLKRIDALRIF